MYGRCTAQTVNSFPHFWNSLHVRAEKCDALMRGNHWNEGAIMQHVIFPPVGKETPIVGSQEDCTFHTGGYLAALSYRYAVTRDEQVRDWADEVMNGILKLEAVTGIPGCVARSFNKTPGPNPHEKWFFFPQEWHESTALPGYRWEGDLSSDQLTGLMYGLALYFDLCADDAHKKIAAGFVDRVMGRCVDHNFRIIDADGKMTLWGNFCPALPHENLNALLIISHLRTAHHMTGKPRYLDAYRELIEKYHYDDQAIMAKVLWPKDWVNDSDDELGIMALCNLMRYEDNPALLQKYRMSLNRHAFLWKKKPSAFTTLISRTLNDGDETDAELRGQLRHESGVNRRHSWLKIPREDEDGFTHIWVKQEDNAVWFLRDYWMARYHKFIVSGD